jgi:hypothetical protein
MANLQRPNLERRTSDLKQNQRISTREETHRMKNLLRLLRLLGLIILLALIFAYHAQMFTYVYHYRLPPSPEFLEPPDWTT